ncbi:hypothetical protein [Pseudomonas pseudonitroreducens]|uniref:hypothetical protein n=1 Tax=Pseudomonas pseudonitroreducens TaxID=2892326 RepID=UPI001F3B52D2|nr:hypothetical protein [Pseudomonas pseudonitroreducens]
MLEQQACTSAQVAFQREDRYIVIKRKDLNTVPFAALQSFLEHLGVLASFLPRHEFVVVESDWPEYETVWAMLAARIEGRATPYQLLEQQVAALRQHKNDYMEAAEGTRLALEAEAQALREEISRLHSTMVAAAEEIHEHWDAHCDEEGYGPSNLMYRLEKCIDADYPGYTAGAFAQLREQVAALRARVVVPDGYAIVPVELTRDMWVAVNKEDDRAYAGACDHGAQFDWLWQAAIDAAPRLNGKAVSEGLLRENAQAINDLVWAIQARPSCQKGIAAQCRCSSCAIERGVEVRKRISAMLGEGKEDGDA